MVKDPPCVFYICLDICYMLFNVKGRNTNLVNNNELHNPSFKHRISLFSIKIFHFIALWHMRWEKLQQQIKEQKW